MALTKRYKAVLDGNGIAAYGAVYCTSPSRITVDSSDSHRTIGNDVHHLKELYAYFWVPPGRHQDIAYLKHVRPPFHSGEPITHFQIDLVGGEALRRNTPIGKSLTLHSAVFQRKVEVKTDPSRLISECDWVNGPILGQMNGRMLDINAASHPIKRNQVEAA